MSNNWIEELQRLRDTEDYAIQDDAKEDKNVSSADQSYLRKLFGSNLVPTKEEDIEALQNDPNDILYSIKSFSELNIKKELFEGICSLGFRKPSSIQEKVLPLIINDKNDLIVQAQSGTGKSTMFLLGLLNSISSDIEFCQAICLAPTIELAKQLFDVAINMSKFMENVNLGLLVRESSCLTDTDGYLKNKLIFATPGIVNNILMKNRREKIKTDHLCWIVYDEADIMLEVPGFFEVMQNIKKLLPEQKRTLLFSATYNDEIDNTIRTIVKNPTFIRVKKSELSLKNISQFYIPTRDPEEKYKWLVEIYMSYSIGQAIIFCATRKMSAILKERLTNDGHHVGVLTAALTLGEREEVIKSFRSGKERVLISTNLCSRGLDIPQVNLVINWDMPLDVNMQPDCETYLHRIGRSGRFGKKGLAINFVTPRDVPTLEAIKKYFDIEIPILTQEILEDM